MKAAIIKMTLEGLVTIALEKGLINPKFSIEIEANCNYYCRFSWLADSLGTSQTDSAFFATPEECIELMRTRLFAVPSLIERQRNEYLKKLAATVEYGKKIGIDDDFINPLVAQMKALSANVIEYVPFEGRTKPLVDFKDFEVDKNGDDIPF